MNLYEYVRVDILRWNNEPFCDDIYRLPDPTALFSDVPKAIDRQSLYVNSIFCRL